MEENKIKNRISEFFIFFISFMINLVICLIFGLIGAGCFAGIVFLCNLCYNMICGGPLW